MMIVRAAESDLRRPKAAPGTRTKVSKGITYLDRSCQSCLALELRCLNSDVGVHFMSARHPLPTACFGDLQQIYPIGFTQDYRGVYRESKAFLGNDDGVLLIRRYACVRASHRHNRSTARGRRSIDRIEVPAIETVRQPTAWLIDQLDRLLH